MPGFLYFLPGPSQPSAAEWRAAGLGYAFDASPAVRGCTGGPGGQNGAILADPRTPAEEVGYFPDRQTWRQLHVPRSTVHRPPSTPACPPTAAYVGYSALPSPQDLARPEQLRGHWLTLLDERQWLVPVARAYTEEDGDLRWFHNVPQVLELDDAGRWQPGRVTARYAALWELACRWDEASMQAVLSATQEDAGPVTVAFDFQDTVDAAVQVLAANYRLGPTEASLLGILAPHLAREILNAVVDLPTRLAWAEKKTAGLISDTKSSSAGPGG